MLVITVNDSSVTLIFTILPSRRPLKMWPRVKYNKQNVRRSCNKDTTSSPPNGPAKTEHVHWTIYKPSPNTLYTNIHITLYKNTIDLSKGLHVVICSYHFCRLQMIQLQQGLLQNPVWLLSADGHWWQGHPPFLAWSCWSTCVWNMILIIASSANGKQAIQLCYMRSRTFNNSSLISLKRIGTRMQLAINFSKKLNI